jgi:Ca2+-binding RTX toxin-like protein
MAWQHHGTHWGVRAHFTADSSHHGGHWKHVDDDGHGWRESGGRCDDDHGEDPPPAPIVLTGTDAAERLAGGEAGDTLDGAEGNDTLAGFGGDDVLRGGPGGPAFDSDGTQRDFDDDDRIFAGAGADSVDGGWGDDRLGGGEGADTLNGGWGNDTVKAGDGDDLVIGGLISLVNFEDDNELHGGAGNDTLTGQFGDDLLKGDAGDDRLAGQGGANTLEGGEGADLFLFGHGAPLTPVRLIGNDTIQDFAQGTDLIDVSALNYLGGTDDEAYSFIGAAAFSGSGAPELRFEIRDGKTVVELDSTSFFFRADGVADGTIVLAGAFTLSEADFIL